jgi:uncharacterized protein (DUF488 family)
MRQLATIGYEGASPTDFDAALTAAGVDTVVDVRAVALSRKAGFSKTALAERLREQGFEYVHLRGLGDPKPGREAARAGDMALFKRIFGAHMTTPDAQSDLAKLRALASARNIALLCYEADAAGCHRAIVASQVANSGNLSIVHLSVEAGRATGNGRSRTNNHSRQSLAAA